jgi:hypothetical protein
MIQEAVKASRNSTCTSDGTTGSDSLVFERVPLMFSSVANILNGENKQIGVGHGAP